MKRRYGIVVRGTVQGVGFRPYVYRLAHSLGLAGWVANSGDGVHIEIEGEPGSLESFVSRLVREQPPRAGIEDITRTEGDPRGYATFEILESLTGAPPQTFMTPDIAVCPDCLSEMFDPSNRRYRYPFTNCTNCGPRFSIIEKLPYDRPNTTMKIFPMCPDCASEYSNPLDRRFHAQPNACPVCGPALELWGPGGEVMAAGEEALQAAEKAVSAGRILALKGLGGFQLLVDATDAPAVARLRARKQREEKPFAMMVQSIEEAASLCDLSPGEEDLLRSPEAPIVLMRRTSSRARVAEEVAPRNPYLGIMLPYTPLHHLLMHDIRRPVVATSGNRSDEPICIDEHDALRRLGDIADLFLVHNRPIRRHVDDSVVRLVCGRPYVLRRARGYTPRPVHVGSGDGILAVGGHLKNSIAVASNGYVFLSQHIGDLDTQESYSAFERAVDDLTTQHAIRAARVVADQHPDYASTSYALHTGLPVETVQHHYAHVASCMADNELQGPVLGVSWDGTGYGTDGTVWGGEFILTTETSWRRVASFRPFKLPGGELAVREPRRSALGVLFECFGSDAFEMAHLAPVQAWTDTERRILRNMLENGVNSPSTSSVGRLFDAVASLCNLRQKMNFEGQAAMELEFAATGQPAGKNYSYIVQDHRDGGLLLIDWRPMLREILRELQEGAASTAIAARFHTTLVDIIADIAKRVALPTVVLTGGCFQNVTLLTETISRLRREGFTPHWHRDIPPNDGGLALGQIVALARQEVGYMQGITAQRTPT